MFIMKYKWNHKHSDEITAYLRTCFYVHKWLDFQRFIDEIPKLNGQALITNKNRSSLHKKISKLRIQSFTNSLEFISIFS